MGEPDEFVDMGAVGAKVGSLQLSMLNKSPIDSDRPQDEEMVMIKRAPKFTALLFQDDLDGSDITIY